MEETNEVQETAPSKNPWFPEAYVQTLELADGETLKGHAALNTIEDTLWVWIDESMSMGKACLIFEDPEKTGTIISHTSEIETLTFEGYTRLDIIRTDVAGKISIRMRK